MQKSAGKPVLFDLNLAQELYVALIGPIEELVKDRRHLLVVPSGALTSLPFDLLVTEKPAQPVLWVKDIARYRDAAWLPKRHAVSVLPSVASLKALRAFAHKDVAGKPMVGFGDPLFDPSAPAANTIAGDKPGAEASSGLARDFFYAGARALLVSHWAVESNAAMRLTTSTFDIMKSDPMLGRAEALRRGHARLHERRHGREIPCGGRASGNLGPPTRAKEKCPDCTVRACGSWQP
jgi:CHAT domain-containing protein